MADDAVLLTRYAKDRDAEAFAELVRRYAGMVYGVCLRVAGNPHDAEDIAQECFMDLARQSESIRTSLSGWLHRVAVNHASNAVRSNARRRRREKKAANSIVAESPDDLSWQEAAPYVDRALEELPRELRKPLILHFLEEKSQVEVAEQIGVDRSTISRRLDKGIGELRGRLKKAGVIVPAALLAALLKQNAAVAAPAALKASLVKMAMAGVGTMAAAQGAAATTGGLAAMKTGLIAVITAGIIAAGGLAVHSAMKKEPTPPAPPPKGAETRTVHPLELNLPDEVLVVIESPNFLNTVNGYADYFSAAVPSMSEQIPDPRQEMMKVAIKKVALTESPAVFNITQPVRWLFMKSERGLSQPITVLSVTNSEEYLAGIRKDIKRVGQIGDILIYEHEKWRWYQEAYDRATPEERRNPQAFRKPYTESIFIGLKDNMVCLGQNQADVERIHSLLKTGEINETPLLNSQGALLAFVRVRAMIEHMESAEQSVLKAIRTQIAQGAKQAQAAGNPSMRLSTMGYLLGSTVDLGSQIECAWGRLDMTSDMLRSEVGIEAAPDTSLAQYLNSVPSGLPDVLKYVPDDAMALVATRMVSGDSAPAGLSQWRNPFMAAFAQSGEAESERIQVPDIHETLGDQFALALRPGDTVNRLKIIRLNDPEKARALLNGYPPIAWRIFQLQQFMGGREQDRKTLEAPSQPTSRWELPLPKDNGANTIPMSVDVFRALLGSTAIVDADMSGKDWIISLGEPSQETFNRIVKEEMPKLQDDPSFQTNVLAHVPAHAEGLVYMRLAEFISWMLRMKTKIDPMPNYADAEFQSGPGCLAVLDIDGPRAALDIRLPAEEYRSLMEPFLKLQQDRVEEARLQAQCRSNLANICRAITLYRENYEGLMPHTLDELVPEYLTQDLLHCPAVETRQLSYVWLGRLPKEIMPSLTSDMIILYTRKGNHPGGRNAGSFDMAVRWLLEEKFQKTLKQQYNRMQKLFDQKGMKIPEHVEAFYSGALNPD